MPLDLPLHRGVVLSPLTAAVLRTQEYDVNVGSWTRHDPTAYSLTLSKRVPSCDYALRIELLFRYFPNELDMGERFRLSIWAFRYHSSKPPFKGDNPLTSSAMGEPTTFVLSYLRSTPFPRLGFPNIHFRSPWGTMVTLKIRLEVMLLDIASLEPPSHLLIDVLETKVAQKYSSSTMDYDAESTVPVREEQKPLVLEPAPSRQG